MAGRWLWAEQPASEPDVIEPSIDANPADLDAHLNAVRDAASTSLGLWLSYLFFLFYLAVSIGNITHRDILFEVPVKLLILNVDLPFIAFFILAPILMIISHAYAMIHFVFLGTKISEFNNELRRQTRDLAISEKLRRKLPGNIFVQVLAGPSEIRDGPLGKLLGGVAWITLVVFPVILLLLIQIRFLPYHSEAISWLHRLSILIDLVMLGFLWPALLRGTASLRLPRFRLPSFWWYGSIVALLLSFAVTTFPGETAHRIFPAVRFLPEAYLPIAWRGQRWLSVHDLLFDGGLFANILIAPGVSAPGSSQGEAGRAMVSLRKRELAGAILSGADLQGVDFTGANLRGANFDDANLHRAMFCDVWTCAEMARASFRKASLPRVELKNAHLEHAVFDFANLQQSILDYIHLDGALMENVRLEGASLLQASLPGANLRRAHLDGALLDYAHLEGADLLGASLNGASLRRVRLQGANMGVVHLRGAQLVQAQLQGVHLGASDLRGASLDQARLQGAIIASRLDGSSFVAVHLWRAQISPVTLEDAEKVPLRMQGIKLDQTDWPDHEEPEQPWTLESYNELRRELEGVPFNDKERREEALRMIDRLDPSRPFQEEVDVKQAWTKLQARQSQFSASQYQRTVAAELQAAGCDEEAGSFIVDSLFRPKLDSEGRPFVAENTKAGVKMAFQYSPLAAADDAALEVVEMFLNPMKCDNASALSDVMKRRLRILSRELNNERASKSPSVHP